MSDATDTPASPAPPPAPPPVRLGLVGCGAIGAYHASTFDRIDGLAFAAAADRNDGRRDAVIGDRPGVARFDDGESLIASGTCDAVLIAAPHFAHPPLSILALETGLHVLSEKPVAVTAAEAERVNAVAARHPHLKYGVVYNQRAWPVWRAVRRMIDGGAIGPLRRASYTITDWFRTQAYYDAGRSTASGGWRGTWAGEGGGVLVNQCPHQLDLLQWLCGMPARVTAIVGVGKHHAVEVEDDVTALLEWPPGPDGFSATGTFVTTTGESPGVNRLEIVGDHGTLVTDGRTTVDLYANARPTGDYVRTSDDAGTDARVPHARTTTHFDAVRKGHEAITANFVDSIRTGAPLIAPGVEGVRGVDLANAMLMSGLTRRPVDLPTDRAAFADLLDRLRRGGRP